MRKRNIYSASSSTTFVKESAFLFEASSLKKNNIKNMNQTTNQQIRTLILNIKDYVMELIRKWYWFVIMGILFLGVTLYQVNKQPITYIGKLSFMTNNDSGGGVSRLLQFAGQFGLGGNQPVASERLVELLKSKQMIYRALMQEVEINNSKELLFNHYINLFNLRANWQDNEELKDFKFTKKDIKDFTFLENSVSQSIYNQILFGTLDANPGKNGITSIRCESTSEAFSKEFLIVLIQTLSDYYQDKAVEQQHNTYELIKGTADSVQTVLRNAEYALTAWYEENRKPLAAGTLSAKKAMEKERLERKVEMSYEVLLTDLKSLEIARLDLHSNKPMVQVVDYPTYPLPKNFPNKLMKLIVAAILSIGLTTILILANKIIRDAFKEEETN